MDDIALARALHVLGVVHWIGGLTFVTLIVLPLARSRASADEGLALFESVERRFAAQVRISVPLVGVSGLWMTYRLSLWERFIDPSAWWMAAMAGLWLIFMVVLFVVEPMLDAKFKMLSLLDPHAALSWITRLHRFLLLLAALTVFGAVAGVHGFNFF